MMILMYIYPGVGSNALNVLMNSRTQYIFPVTMNMYEMSGRSVLNEALNQCGMGAISARTIDSTKTSESKFVEGVANILQGLTHMTALLDAFVADGRAVFSSYKE
jgi:hypothetical protein